MEQAQIEKQPNLPEQERAQRALLMFAAMTVLVVLGGALIGIIVSLAANLIYIEFFFPLGMGLAGGSLVKDAIRIVKTRKTSQLIFLSLMKIEKPGDVEGALREALAQKDRLVFLDVITDQTENVFPMVPGGKGLTEMILAEEL
jgi:hypothetical protein